MNKKQKIFGFSMILILLVAISVPVDAAMRTTIINPKITTGHITNDVFKNSKIGDKLDYSKLSIYQQSEVNKLIHGQIDTKRIKDIELGLHLSGSDDKPIIISHIDDILVITSVDDKNKEKYVKLLPMPRKATPSPALPSDGGPGGPPTPPPTLPLPTPVMGDLTELMWYTPTLNELLINKTTLNQARLESLNFQVLSDYIIVRADVLSIPTPSPTVKPTSTPTSTPSPTPTPCFEFLFAIIGVLAAIYLIKRRR